MSGVFLVYSDETGEYALPERAGWTSQRLLAGHYTEDRADKAAETMLDGTRCCISLVPVAVSKIARQLANIQREETMTDATQSPALRAQLLLSHMVTADSALACHTSERLWAETARVAEEHRAELVAWSKTPLALTMPGCGRWPGCCRDPPRHPHAAPDRARLGAEPLAGSVGPAARRAAHLGPDRRGRGQD
jgi:hypothetical protein